MIKIIGLAARARKITFGTNITIANVRINKVKLVLLASDAANNTKKLINDKCQTNRVLVIDDFSSKELSNAVGKNNMMVLGVIDEGFSKLILNQKRK